MVQKKRVPQKRVHRGKGLDYVRDPRDGKVHYLGPAGTVESHERYQQWLARYVQETGASASEAKTRPVQTVRALMIRWLEQGQRDYRRPDGTLTDTYTCCATVAEKYLLHLADKYVADLTRADLVAVQREMIDRGTMRGGVRQPLAVKTLREYMRTVKHLVRFGVNEGVIDPYQSAHLLNLPPIRANEGRRSKKVRAIPIKDLFKLYRELNPPWKEILAFHVLTGQRVETVLRATAKEFDTSSVPWKFVPTMHKTSWRGHDLTVLVGPRARKILQPLMGHEGYFWPARKMNVKKGRQARNFPRTSSAYKNALERACDRAGIPKYTPQQIRHTTATWLVGRGVAESIIGAILGHHGRGDDDSLATGSGTITGRYAAVPRRRVEAVVEKWG